MWKLSSAKIISKMNDYSVLMYLCIMFVIYGGNVAAMEEDEPLQWVKHKRRTLSIFAMSKILLLNERRRLVLLRSLLFRQSTGSAAPVHSSGDAFRGDISVGSLLCSLRMSTADGWQSSSFLEQSGCWLQQWRWKGRIVQRVKQFILSVFLFRIICSSFFHCVNLKVFNFNNAKLSIDEITKSVPLLLICTSNPSSIAEKLWNIYFTVIQGYQKMKQFFPGYFLWCGYPGYTFIIPISWNFSQFG